MKKNTLEFKLVAMFSGALLMLLLAGWQMQNSLNSYITTANWVSHTYEVLDALDEVVAGMKELEAGQRNFLITGDETYQATHASTITRIRQALIRLNKLTIDNQQQQLRLVKLDAIVTERIQLLDKTMELYRTEGFEAARARIKTGIAHITMAELLKHAGEMESTERSLLAQRNAATEQRARQALNIGNLMVALSLLAMVLLWFKIRHEMGVRREAEVAVRESETTLQQILELLPVAVFICDKSGQLTRVNPAGKELWAGEHLVGTEKYSEYQGWWPDTGKPIAADEWALARTIKSGATIRNEMADILCFDGSRKSIVNHTMPIRNAQGEMVGGIAVNVDITAFKRTERELRAAASYDETIGAALSLFSSSFERRSILDGLLCLLAAQHAYPLSALYLYDEWSGNFSCQAAHGAACDMTREFALGEGLMGQAALDGKTVALDTGALKLQTGLADFVPAQVLMIPVNYQEKRLAVLVLAGTRPATDSDRAFLERLAAQLGVALHNLKQYGDLKLLAEQLRTSSEEIISKNRQLEEASRMKSEFLANMSHELRTPLNAIIGFAEVLKDGLMGELTPQQQDCTSDIFSAGSHLLSLINDILDLSKVEAGKMTLDLEPVRVTSLLQTGLQVIKEKALAHRLQLTQSVPENLGELCMDKRKAKQILYNLLSNAVKFTPEGGSVHLSAAKVAGSAVEGGHFDHYLELAVRDTGIGIAAEDQARLFQPFVQIDSKLSRRYEGTGLGLAMVRRLTELHEGAVSLHSVPGQGSTFTVWLPWRDPEPEPAVPAIPAIPAMTPAPAQRYAGAELSVLMIEDDDKAADILSMQLETQHFRIVRAATAESALEILSKEKPDLITLDIMLPGMNGWDFLEHIKAEQHLADIPVVIVSIVADRNRGAALGAAQVLQKPVAREDLLHALTVLGFHSNAHDSPTALVADDDPKAVQLLSAYLDSAGYRVLPAFGGAACIDAVRHAHPDLIILDLMMPEVSGFDVVDALRQDPSTAAIPIIVVTAKQITAADRERLNGAVLKIIEKSEFNHASFIAEVRRAMTRKEKSI